jgi:hypothetical protein
MIAAFVAGVSLPPSAPVGAGETPSVAAIDPVVVHC